jgi:ribonucleoside-diphosphate reductase alpha chain
LWKKIIDSQIETGTPYLLYKDACNRKSNQQNVGTIKSSNLCAEIIQYSSPDETAVCNLASIALPKCVEDGVFNFTVLEKCTRILVRNLNRIIDQNYYPTETAKRSNFRHRPTGIGVQGLADVFQMLMYPFESKQAAALNKNIFETMYYAAVHESSVLSERDGPYPSFTGSPASQGKLQFDLWGVSPSDRYPWAELKERVKRVGLRNSLLISMMPTASTSQILGNNECIEPYTSNLYIRRVLSGEYYVLNKHLVKALERERLWTKEMKDSLIEQRGSIQGIDGIPTKIKKVFKTVWEMKQKTLINLARDRGPYVCQSQSLNLFLPNPSQSKCTSMHFYTWESGLKTGIYYLRSKPAVNAIAFTVNKKRKLNDTNPTHDPMQLPPEECLSCGS